MSRECPQTSWHRSEWETSIRTAYSDYCHAGEGKDRQSVRLTEVLRNAVQSGWTISEIARLLSVSRQSISRRLEK